MIIKYFDNKLTSTFETFNKQCISIKTEFTYEELSLKIDDSHKPRSKNA